MRFIAVIWNANTNVSGGGDDPGLSKAIAGLNMLEDNVRAANQICLHHEAVTGRKYPLFVFLAPEYYFAKNVQRHFIEHSEKRQIISRLQALSRAAPKMLIIPGTVPWWRKAYQAKPKDLKGKKKDEQRVLKTVARLRDREATKKWYPDVLLPDFSKLIEGKERDMYIAQNTAYIVYKRKVLKYHKFGNFNEVEGDSADHRAVVFAPGSRSGQFSIGPLKFGLEICLDHALGFLKCAAQADGGVHVHLIVSAFVEQEGDKLALRPGGVALHASCAPGLAKALPTWLPPSSVNLILENGAFAFQEVEIPDSVIGGTVTEAHTLSSPYLDFSNRSRK